MNNGAHTKMLTRQLNDRESMHARAELQAGAAALTDRQRRIARGMVAGRERVDLARDLRMNLRTMDMDWHQCLGVAGYRSRDVRGVHPVVWMLLVLCAGGERPVSLTLEEEYDLAERAQLLTGANLAISFEIVQGHTFRDVAADRHVSPPTIGRAFRAALRTAGHTGRLDGVAWMYLVLLLRGAVPESHPGAWARAAVAYHACFGPAGTGA